MPAVTLPAALKLKPFAPQTVQAGNPLGLTVIVEDAETWQGKVRFSLAADTPPGELIDPQSGEFSWTPPPDQAAGRYGVTILAVGLDGRKDETSFVATVLRTIPPLRLQAVGPRTVEAGKGLRVIVSPEDPAQWQGKVRFSLAADAPPGAKIDRQTGEFTWTPPAAWAGAATGNHRFGYRPGGANHPGHLRRRCDAAAPPPGPPGAKEIAVDLGRGVKLEMS